MLELRPNCECCDRDLPAASREAMMCSYECTYCADCAAGVLQGICPNCSGELVRRSVRPSARLVANPASNLRVSKAEGCVPSKAA